LANWLPALSTTAAANSGSKPLSLTCGAHTHARGGGGGGWRCGVGQPMKGKTKQLQRLCTGQGSVEPGLVQVATPRGHHPLKLRSAPSLPACPHPLTHPPTHLLDQALAQAVHQPRLLDLIDQGAREAGHVDLRGAGARLKRWLTCEPAALDW
jgi:hypothetical protein